MVSEPPLLDRYKSLFGENKNSRETSYCQEEEDIINININTSKKEHEELPVVDLSRGVELCEKEIVDAAKEWGFFQVVNHGICPDLLCKLKDEQLKLFRQPFHHKANQNYPPINNFMSSLSSATGSYYRWGNQAATTLNQFSWSEAFYVPVSNLSAFADFNNLSCSSAILEFTEAVSGLTKRLGDILAANIVGGGRKLVSNNSYVEPSSSSCFVRLNRYPPCPIPASFGLVPHTDSDFLTILYQDQLGGLQLQKDGLWIDVKPNPNALVVNIGDLFQAWSNDVYKSVRHRVVTNGESERFSVAYFCCPPADTLIRSCIQPSLYRDFTFRDFRRQVQHDVNSTGSKIGLSWFLK